MRNKLMQAGEFAQKALVTLATLYHYDKMGLLVPMIRGENNYRYYSLRQLPEVNLIRTLQELGLSLNEIKTIMERRAPDTFAEMLKCQVEKIDEKINGWISSRKLLVTLQDMLMAVRDVDEAAISIQYLPGAPIVVGEWNSYRDGEDAYDALVSFYDFISKQRPKINIGFPVWGLFTKENIRVKLGGEDTWPDRYYFYHPDGQKQRPAGLYAIGYTRGDYGQHRETYARLHGYIDEHNFDICGNAYEEYPLNEASSTDSTNYLVRIMIQVRQRQ